MADPQSQPLIDPALSPLRAGASGAAAAFVYLGVMYADIAVTGSPSDDLLMLGRPLTKNRAQARALGLLAHTAFGTTVGVLYGAIGRRRLTGPEWLRGVTMLMIENTALWPLSFVADRFHPSMQSGELPKLNRPLPFLQQIVRHVAFGATLGYLYGRSLPRDSSR